MEQFPTDTVDYADIVLPADHADRAPDVNAGYGHPTCPSTSPAATPPGECLSTTETFRRLAAHMGIDEPALFDSDLELAESLLSSGHPSLEGITVDRLRKEGWVRMNYREPFTPFAEGFPTASGRLRFLAAGQGVRARPCPLYAAGARGRTR